MCIFQLSQVAVRALVRSFVRCNRVSPRGPLVACLRTMSAGQSRGRLVSPAGHSSQPLHLDHRKRATSAIAPGEGQPSLARLTFLALHVNEQSERVAHCHGPIDGCFSLVGGGGMC